MPRAAAVIFDAYGTLLDVGSATQKHAERIGPKWESLSVQWRAKQLEYAWVRSLTGPAHHEDFWLCTRDALDVVMARNGLHDAQLKHDLLEAYRVLDAYPEVPGILRELRAAGIPAAILSNGSPFMLESAVQAAGIDKLLDSVLSVEEVGVFKPDPRVYQLATRQYGCPADQMVFVSANPWDGQAAAHAGFQVVRINRDGSPDEYGLAAMLLAELPNLSALPEMAGV